MPVDGFGFDSCETRQPQYLDIGVGAGFVADEWNSRLGVALMMIIIIGSTTRKQEEEEEEEEDDDQHQGASTTIEDTFDHLRLDTKSGYRATPWSGAKI